jgi:hypothetical protein
MNTYKRFKVGDIVMVKIITECQYYNYPNIGDNNKTLKPNEKAIIVSISPKVRITEVGTGEYFFNLVRYDSRDNTYYPVTDYHNLISIKNCE